MAQQLWAGVDAGKSDHHCVVIDTDGQRLVSQRVANDEAALLDLIEGVATLADGGEVTWAIDLNAGGAGLLITLLIAADQRLLYIPGRTVYHASGGYRGDGKTDCGHSVRGVLPVAGPKDRSASCLLGDTSATGRTSPSVSGRTRCGLIGA